MTRRYLGLAVIAAATLGLSGAAQPPKLSPKDAAKAKKELQRLQEFIGVWELEGTQKVGAKTEAWKEKVSWGWRFKGDDAYITVDFDGGKGKYYKDGELRYDPAKKKYQLTLTTQSKASEVYTGDLKIGVLRVERKDAATGDVHRLTMNTAADGVRFILKSEVQEGGKGIFLASYQMAGNREGESLGAVKKRPECIVTGGAATIQVSFQGKTYFVCCSGCRDAFMENPEKFVKGK